MNQQYVMHSFSLNSVSIAKMLTKIHHAKVLTQALTDIPYKTENLYARLLPHYHCMAPIDLWTKASPNFVLNT